MTTVGVLVAVGLAFQAVLPAPSSLEKSPQTPLKVLSRADCKELGILALDLETIRERLADGELRRRRVISLSLSESGRRDTSNKIWSREETLSNIVPTTSQIAGAVGCDWRVQEIFLVLIKGGPLAFEGEMIRLTRTIPRRSTRKIPIQSLQFSETKLGVFRYRPHLYAAGVTLVSSQQFGRRMLLHLEADGMGAYTGVLFLLDFDAGSAREVKLQEAPPKPKYNPNIWNPGPIDPTLPVPWEPGLEEVDSSPNSGSESPTKELDGNGDQDPPLRDGAHSKRRLLDGLARNGELMALTDALCSWGRRCHSDDPNVSEVNT